MAENVRTKIDRDKRIVEINCEFLQIIPKKDLYQIEESIRAAYELNFVRLIPRYPGELFTKSYMREVMYELQRVGAVSRGFFNEYDCRISGDHIEIEISFNNGGVELLYSAKTNEIISNIIYGEFGRRFSVDIKQDSSCDVGDGFFAGQLAELEKQARSAQVELAHQRAFRHENV